ncbi:MAG TPA: ribonuclease domain-containing protein [Nocardioides sp.]|nr:ribonuclease domain-containing protein [Nocardioides sp.]
MRGILGGRRTFAAALVIVVLASIVIGALRDDEGDDDASDDSSSGTPSSQVSTDGSPTASPSGPAFPTAVAPSNAETDPESGLPVVNVTDLPPEAVETLELIDAGGPFPYSDDGETFLNSAGLLPEQEPGYYRVYTVDTPDSDEATNRRVVTGQVDEFYWTDDLYTSFRRIER